MLGYGKKVNKCVKKLFYVSFEIKYNNRCIYRKSIKIFRQSAYWEECPWLDEGFTSGIELSRLRKHRIMSYLNETDWRWFRRLILWLENNKSCADVCITIYAKSNDISNFIHMITIYEKDLPHKYHTHVLIAVMYRFKPSKTTTNAQVSRVYKKN